MWFLNHFYIIQIHLHVYHFQNILINLHQHNKRLNLSESILNDSEFQVMEGEGKLRAASLRVCEFASCTIV